MDVTLDKTFLGLPADTDQGDLSPVNEWEFHLQELTTFFSNREGSRVYHPGWGFNFGSEDEPYTTDELRAVIVAKLNNFFSYLTIPSVIVVEDSPGGFQVEITIEQNGQGQTVTLKL